MRQEVDNFKEEPNEYFSERYPIDEPDYTDEYGRRASFYIDRPMSARDAARRGYVYVPDDGIAFTEEQDIRTVRQYNSHNPNVKRSIAHSGNNLGFTYEQELHVGKKRSASWWFAMFSLIFSAIAIPLFVVPALLPHLFGIDLPAIAAWGFIGLTGTMQLPVAIASTCLSFSQRNKNEQAQKRNRHIPGLKDGLEMALASLFISVVMMIALVAYLPGM